MKLRSDERTVSVAAVSHLQRHCIFLYEVKIKARSQSIVQLNALWGFAAKALLVLTSSE